jgi:predicted TIM-barrel fold metal-dependent hydrolase
MLGPLNFYQHLASLTIQGVLERVPDLKVVFVDGGYDMLMPLFWRADKDWQGIRFETPWVKKLPTDYFRGRVYFCMYLLEAGPLDPAQQAAWWEISDGGRTVMYASHFPRWHYFDPTIASNSLPEEVRARVMGENAVELYRLAPTKASL